MPALEEKYSQFADFIDQSRRAGHTDSAIESYIITNFNVDRVDTLPAEIGFFEALRRNVARDPGSTLPEAVEVPLNILGVPQELLSAALSADEEEGFLSRFARGQNPSEVLGLEGVTGGVTDAILDPINLLSGAGIVSKIGKAAAAVSKGAKASDAIQDVVQSVRRVKEITDVKQFDEFGEPAANMLRQAASHDEIQGARAAQRMTNDELLQLGQTRKGAVAGKVVEGIYDPDKAGLVESAALKLLVGDRIGDILVALSKGEPDEFIKQVVLGASGGGRRLQLEKARIPVSKAQLEKARRAIAETPEGPELEIMQMIAKSIGLDKGAIDPSALEKFVEWATMIKLTGLSSHVRGVAGNSSMVLLRPIEKFTAGATQAAAAKAGLLSGGQTVFMREALAEGMAMAKALPEAFSKMWRFLGSPTEYFDEVTKAGEVLLRGGAIGRGGALADVIERATGKGFNLGEAVRLPGRLIGAVDVFFKHLNYNAELFGLATRQALKEGLKQEKLVKRVAELVDNTNIKDPIVRKIRASAEFSARERVFQQALPGLAKTANEFRRKHPIARLLVPFFNTPVNLFIQSIQRTPLGLIPVFKKGWKTAYGRELTPEIRAELLGRSLSGSAFMSMVAWWGLNGRISGRGTKSKDRNDLLRLTGWQPNSVRVGNSWVSYQGFEPLTSWFRTIADATDAKDKDGELRLDPTKLVFSYVQQFAENPFLMGVNDVFEALKDPEGKTSRFLAGLVTGSTIPVILQQWGKTVYDPVVREPKGFIERVAARVPFGVSETVAAKRNIFGEEIERDLRGIPTAFGFTTSLKKGGKLEQELNKMAQGENPITLGRPSRTLGGLELSSEEYSRMFVLRGAMIKESLEKLVNHPNYDTMTLDARKLAINRIVLNINRFAKSQAMNKYITERLQ